MNFSKSFLAQLEQYAWPGNVRELANVIRRTIALGREQSPFEHCDPPRSEESAPTHLVRLKALGLPGQFEAGMSLQTAEKRLLELTLAATAGNRSHAAEMLGISVRTVRNKIREYNLPPRRSYAGIHN